MNKIFILACYLFSCSMIHASSSSNEKPTRVRSTSEESIETVISSISSQPEIIAPQPQVIHRDAPVVYDHLTRRQVLLQTAQSYKDEIKDCYTNGFYNGCYKCCNTPIARPDLNPHPQIQDCRAKCSLGFYVCLIGGGCLTLFGYSIVHYQCIA